MQKKSLTGTRALAVGLAALLAAGPALADRPSWAGNGGAEHQRRDRDERGGPPGGHERYAHDGDRGGRGGRSGIQVDIHFGDRQRTVVREYYHEEFRGGRCPPGLAKKGNGCMPPGQAKRWRVGHPLPRDVVYYDLPPRVVVELGVPPPGYRYVRVAADVLMIAVGTGMVVDAIEDLGR